VTVYEHFMLGANLGLAANLHRFYGWRLVALAGAAAALPDWDGLSILFGAQAYARAHRIWGHNLLVASILGALAGGAAYAVTLSPLVRKSIARLQLRLLPAAPPPPASAPSLITAAVWMGTGLIASLSHLLADYFYSGQRGGSVWPLQLLWPFSNRGWAYPVLPWGDLGATCLFIVEMFALYRWPSRARLIATITLATVVGYVVIRV
jgi:membrane-bound metal-dependent hydrolase YbcI (DUF457 family)